MSTRYLPVAEAARLIRAVLKESLPGVKFSVRSSSYAGGASIRVGWIDGPDKAMVEPLLAPFTGSSFDGMTDSTTTLYGWLDGERVHFGSDYIHTSRDWSDEAVEQAIWRVFTRYEGNFREAGVERPTLEGYRRGAYWSVQLPGLHRFGGENVQAEIGQALAEQCDRPCALPSVTLARVRPVAPEASASADRQAA